MKLLIAGSRSLAGRDNDVFKYMDSLFLDVTEIISGGACGIDLIGEKWAIANRIPIRRIKPDWAKYGKSAGIIRNSDLVNSADLVIIFWDGVSKGTADTKKKAEKQKKLHSVIIL